MTPLPMTKMFQHAYVTGDLDTGAEFAGRMFGIADYLRFDTRQFALPGAEGPFMRVALGWVGEVMIEIIEPDRTSPSIYAEAMGAARPLMFHHIAYLVEPAAFAGLSAQLAADDIAMPIERTSGGVSFLYADVVAQVGHYIEFVEDGLAWRRLSAGVPR